MKKRASNNFLRKNSFKSNMTNFLSLFLSLILYVNSFEEGKNVSMYKDNEFLLLLTKNLSNYPRPLEVRVLLNFLFLHPCLRQ